MLTKFLCNSQACSFRDSYENFKKAGAEVIGISGDDPASHKVKQSSRLRNIYSVAVVIYANII